MKLLKLQKNHTKIISLIFFILVSATSLLANENVSIERMMHKDSKFSGEFSLTGNSLVQDVGEVVGNKYWGDLHLNYSKENHYNADLRMRYNDAEAFFFSVPLAYLRYDLGIDGENGELYVGRALLDWSKLDSTWGFGRINNRMNFDFFEPGEEGLTGLQYNVKYKRLLISAFASYLYIPELNPGQKYDKDKGTIECNNPWCRGVPARDEDTGFRIVYDIDMPDYSDIILNYSVGLNLGYDFSIGRIKGFYLRKPENQITVSANIQAEVVDSETIIDAQIIPKIYYHDVLGANIEFDINKHLMIYGSYISFDPDSQPEGSEKVFQYLKRKTLKKKEEYAGLGTVYSNNNYFVKINYIARISEYEIDVDTLVEYPRWNQAINLNYTSKLSEKLGIEFDIKFDMLTADRLGMLKLNYALSSNLQTGAGVKVIGEDSDEESYWSAFSNNDMAYVTLSYTF